MGGRSKSRFRSDQGFSLIGVLAGMGILAIGTLGAMSLAQNMFLISNTSDVQAEIQQEMFYLQNGIAPERTCSANFRNLVVGDDPVLLPENLRLRFLNAPPSTEFSDHYIMPSQDPAIHGKVRVDSLRLVRHVGSTDIVALEVNFRPRGKVLGGDVRTRRLPLRMQVDASSRVVRCFAQRTGEDGDDSDHGQGEACGPPSGVTLTNFLGSRGGGFPAGDRELTGADFQETIRHLCAIQSYPVPETGMKVPASEWQNCVNSIMAPGLPSVQCAALMHFLSAETAEAPVVRIHSGQGGSGGIPGYNKGLPSWTNQSMLRLANRHSYADRESCQQQKIFSEGNLLVHEDPAGAVPPHSAPPMATKICVNGKWITVSRQVITWHEDDPSGYGGYGD